ncbi:MAG: Pvc16 family protein, partial [Acidobacteriota bacterium]
VEQAAAGELFFLLSFYGDEVRLVPQLLLGLTTTALHTMPYPSPRYLPQERRNSNPLPDPTEEKLSGSGLLDQIEVLRFAPLQMSHDELSRLWTIFFQIPYTLSVAYLCSVVLLQPEVEPQPSLPVTKPPSVRFNMSHQLPQVTAIKPQVLDYEPGQSVVVEGRNLSPAGLQIKIGDAVAPVVRASTGAAMVQLPPDTPAGILAVTASRETIVGGVKRRLFGESVASLVVRPRIVNPLLYRPATVDDPATVEVGVVPALHPGQPVRLLLNESEPPDNRQPLAYNLSADPAAPGEPLRFKATGVEAGRYLTRLQVSEVASTLQVNDDPTSPEYGHFTGPILSVSNTPPAPGP